MKKRYMRFDSAVTAMMTALTMALVVMIVGLCWSCGEMPPPSETKDVVGANPDSSAVYVRFVPVGKHTYYLLFASCDARHSVEECRQFHGSENVHCFLVHDPDCPCRKAQPAASTVINDDEEESNEEESKDPFDW